MEHVQTLIVGLMRFSKLSAYEMHREVAAMERVVAGLTHVRVSLALPLKLLAEMVRRDLLSGATLMGHDTEHSRDAFDQATNCRELQQSAVRDIVLGVQPLSFGWTEGCKGRAAALSLRGFRPFFCFGENVRERGDGQTHPVCQRQLLHLLGDYDPDASGTVPICYQDPYFTSSNLVKTGYGPSFMQTVRSWFSSGFKHLRPDRIQTFYCGGITAGNIDENLSDGRLDGVLVEIPSVAELLGLAAAVEAAKA